jgi:hypothetical protein
LLLEIGQRTKIPGISIVTTVTVTTTTTAK